MFTSLLWYLWSAAFPETELSQPPALATELSCQILTTFEMVSSPEFDKVKLHHATPLVMKPGRQILAAFEKFSSSGSYPSTPYHKLFYLLVAIGILLWIRVEYLFRKIRLDGARRDAIIAADLVEAIRLHDAIFGTSGESEVEMRKPDSMGSDSSKDKIEGSEGPGTRENDASGQQLSRRVLNTDRAPSTKCLAVKPTEVQKKRNLLNLPRELRGQIFALAMEGEFSSNAYDKTKCVLHKKERKRFHPKCQSHNYDAKAIGLEALQHRNALRLVCVQIHEDVKAIISPPPMLYFCDLGCLCSFDKRFPRNLRPRVRKIAINYDVWLHLDVIDVEREFEKCETSTRLELDTEYPCAPGRAWNMEWQGLTLLSSR